MNNIPKFSILDLSPIAEGMSASNALNNSLEIAQLAERSGYHRYWVAEHHNMPGIASAASSVVIGYIASKTESIRVGSGGVMLPNHSPLIIAEQFGTLGSLYPNRIDLGLGRAPGTDQFTAHALRRSLANDINRFPQDVLELQNYFKHSKKNQRVVAVPGEGLNIPIYILGSSLFGAELAAVLGLPFAFASHFAPKFLFDALNIYRNNFQPSSQLKEPYVIVGFNSYIADSFEEANYLRSSSLKSTINLRKGKTSKLPPPEENYEDKLSIEEKVIVSNLKVCTAIGDYIKVKEEIMKFLKMTKADEIIFVSSIFDHYKRLNSYSLLSNIYQDIRDN